MSQYSSTSDARCYRLSVNSLLSKLMKDGLAVLLRLNRITSPIFFSLDLPPSVPSNPVSNDKQYIHILQINEAIKDYHLFNSLQLKQI